MTGADVAKYAIASELMMLLGAMEVALAIRELAEQTGETPSECLNRLLRDEKEVKG